MVDLLRDGFDVVLGDVFALEFFVGEFDVDFVGEVGDDELFFGESEVLGGVGEEGVLVADDFAVEGVDDGVGLVEEAVDAADLLEVIFPLGGMLDDDSEVDVFIFGFDSPGDFLTLHHLLLT